MTALKDLIRNPTVAELELVAQYGRLRSGAMRTRLFEAFAASGLPHRRMEGWRWSDVKAALPVLSAPPAADLGDPLAEGAAITLVFTASGVQRPQALPAGLRVIEAVDPPALAAADELPMAALAAAAAPVSLLMEVSATSAGRLHLVFTGGAAAAFARVSLLIRSGQSVEVSESYLGSAGLSASVCTYSLEAGAHLSRTVYQRGAPGAVQVITTLIEQAGEADSTHTALVFGARLARLETRLIHQGPASKATLNAAYLAGPGMHADITTMVRHGAHGCQTRQLTKGAVRAQGRGVFQGKFLVPRHTGQATDAAMAHHALLLEEGAEVFAKPELEILADDVQCAHGNTSGGLDESQLFYLRQRGLPLVQARALLTEAFIAEALQAAGEAGEMLRAEAGRWLAQ